MVAQRPMSSKPPPPRKTTQGDTSEVLRGLALLAWVSWEIVALTSLGVLAGWALNRWLRAPLLLAAVFGLLGMSLAFYRIFRAIKKLENQE